MNPYFTDFDIYHSLDNKIPEHLISGNNEKGILVVILENENNSENIQLLTKILQAVDMNLSNDAHFLKIPNGSIYSLNSIMKNNYHQIISFGISANNLGYSFETQLYSPCEILETTFLFAHPLNSISRSQELKKKLWTALQKIYK